MSKQTEALKLALEALEAVTKEMLTLRDEIAERGGRPNTNVFHQRLWDSSFKAYTDSAIPTAEVLRQALANEALDKMAENARELGLDYDVKSDHRLMEQPAQEPVAIELLRYHLDAEGHMVQDRNGEWIEYEVFADAIKPAQQEPFGYFRYDLRLDAWVQNRAGLTGTPFYTTPPQSQPLTDEEIHDIYDEVARREPYNMAVTRRNIARAIEAAHAMKGKA